MSVVAELATKPSSDASTGLEQGDDTRAEEAPKAKARPDFAIPSPIAGVPSNLLPRSPPLYTSSESSGAVVKWRMIRTRGERQKGELERSDFG